MSRPFLLIDGSNVLEQHAEDDERHVADEHGYFCSRGFRKLRHRVQKAWRIYLHLTCHVDMRYVK